MPRYNNRPYTGSVDFLSRFWGRVSVSTGDKCWTWEGPLHHGGYGHGSVSTRRAPMPAHRLAFMLTSGVSAGEGWVCHHCDNPKCCNPSHLYLGTPVSNAQDALRRKRTPWSLKPTRTHCDRGHPYATGNIRWRKTSTTTGRARECLICVRARGRTATARWRAKHAITEKGKRALGGS